MKQKYELFFLRNYKPQPHPFQLYSQDKAYFIVI